MKHFKKFLSVLLCFTIASSLLVTAATPRTYAEEETSKIYGDVSNDSEVKMNDVVLLQKYIAKLVEFTSVQLELADVNDDGDIRMNDVVDIQCFIAGLLESFDADNKPNVDTDTEKASDSEDTDEATDTSPSVSRIDWISELVYELELKINGPEIENEEISFDDVTDPWQVEDIRYAVSAGIIPQDSNFFYPDEPATREFVAVTLVNALGFYGDYPLDCLDESEITEKNAVALALKTNYLSLKKGKFLPHSHLTEKEMNGIMYKIDLLELSTKVSDQYEDIINYKKNVMLANKNAEYEVKNNTFTIASALLGDTGVGDVYILPANDVHPKGFPCKITDITYDGVFAKCEYVTPELGEIYSNISSQGYAEADLSHVEVADDSIEYEIQNSSQSNHPDMPRGSEFNDSDSIKLFDSLNFDLNDFKIKDNLKVSASISILKPTISYAIDADISLDEIDIRNFYIELKKELDFNCTIKTQSGTFPNFSTSVQLAKVPFALGTTGLFVDMIIYLKFSMSGSISISYTFGDLTGIQIKDNVPRYVHSVTKSEFGMDINAALSAGAELKLNLLAFEIFEIMSVSLGAGLKIQVSNFETHGTTVCNDACVWLYANINLTSELLSTKWFSVNCSWDLFTKSNSPFRLDQHFENSIPVYECHFKDDENANNP